MAYFGASHLSTSLPSGSHAHTVDRASFELPGRGTTEGFEPLVPQPDLPWPSPPCPVNDLHLSRLGLAWPEERPSLLGVGSSSSGSSFSGSSRDSPSLYSPASSFASPQLAHAAWPPLQSSSTDGLSRPSTAETRPSTAETCFPTVEEPVVKKKKRRTPKPVLAKDLGYTCEDCGRVFGRRVGLRRHQMSHTGERPYACPEDDCDRTFVQLSALNVHLRVHAGEKPCFCEFPGCDKSFADPGTLARHRKIHNKVIQCPFEGCGKMFARQSSLDVHIQSVHSKPTPEPPPAESLLWPVLEEPDALQDWPLAELPLVPPSLLMPANLLISVPAELAESVEEVTRSIVF